ncbi:MAG: RNA-binding transcriptional accessory protein [Fusobacteriaceae bacterium]|nr:RNA-binding transcriptional accessory protein [Fusobacteriaceae bacterium]MBN2837675.1 RNA-binding transcriptional accessory protein [Fusobacteriaceae bacterium]
MLDLIKIVADELQLSRSSVENTVKLLDEDATVPFIARYRKEVTGSLDEEQIRNIDDKIKYLRNLEKRKEEVLRLIEEQGKLTEDLSKAISKAIKLQEVEDLYLPYKKKKKTKADIAKEQGLEPLANFVLTAKKVEDINIEAEKFITEEVLDVASAVEGAKLILAQNLSENAQYRESLRNRMLKYGIITATLIEKNKSNDEKQVYKDYYAHEEKVSFIASHRTLALNRGEKENILRVAIKFDEKTREFVNIEGINIFKNRQIENFLGEIVIDSLDRLILPSIEREVRNILTEKAEIDSTKIFKENLKNLLMQPPLKEKSILGLDPGFRTGCKTVVINKNGFFEIDDVLYLVEEMHSPKQVENAKNKILSYIEKYDIDIIAIGNGTASRETESFVAKVIKEAKKKVFYIIVNEAGASVYSASKLAAEEFPNLDVTARGAISIARRIQDPLAELVKIDPKSIGVGMYQHDLNQKNLEGSLGEVIESVVNNVGVNANTASWALLSYVSGIKKNIAKNIVDHRQENGNFKNRKQLLKVKGLGEKAYTLAAGFIVVPDGENPLDNTIIHPESYDIAKKMLAETNLSLEDLNDRNKISEKLKNLNVEEFAKKNGFGKETTIDIFNALCKERRDPRDSIPTPILKSDILKIEDLKEGMELEGTVRNVTNFGAFIDIGLKNDALLHISEFPTRINDLLSILSVGDIIKVKIKGVELERGRVSLTKKGL